MMTITIPAPCIEFSIQWPVLQSSLGTLDFPYFPTLKKSNGIILHNLSGSDQQHTYKTFLSHSHPASGCALHLSQKHRPFAFKLNFCKPRKQQLEHAMPALCSQQELSPLTQEPYDLSDIPTRPRSIACLGHLVRHTRMS